MENVIKAIHEIVNDDAKAQIESKYPELFPKGLEVGKWYLNIKALRFIEGFDNTKVKGYGFGLDGYWQDSDLKEAFHFSTIDDKDWQPATEEEVLSALIAEAKKKDLTPNNLPLIKCLCGFNSPRSGKNEYMIESAKYHYEPHPNKLWIVNAGFTDCCVFDNGKWAEIITQKYTMAELESIVGHKFEIV